MTVCKRTTFESKHSLRNPVWTFGRSIREIEEKRDVDALIMYIYKQQKIPLPAPDAFDYEVSEEYTENAGRVVNELLILYHHV